MFDEWFREKIGDMADQVTAGVIDRLCTIFTSLIHGIGIGTIVFAIGVLLGCILIVKVICRVRVLIVLVPLLLAAGYLMSKGFSVESLYHYVSGSN